MITFESRVMLLRHSCRLPVHLVLVLPVCSDTLLDFTFYNQIHIDATQSVMSLLEAHGPEELETSQASLRDV